MGVFDMDAKTMGIYVGGTIHEVAQVVGGEGANSAVLVKITRVVMIVPLLLALGYYIKKTAESASGDEKTKVSVPWFVLGFVGMITLNSLILFSETVLSTVNSIDTFLLTMAMTALGMGTYMEKFKTTGAAPVYVAGIMFI